MEQHCELSRQCYNGPLLGVLAPVLSFGQPPSPQVGVRTKAPQDLVSTLDQKLAQVRVAAFADAHDKSPDTARATFQNAHAT